jgi:hypothetical protein
MERFKWIKTISSSLHPILIKPAPERSFGDYPQMRISVSYVNLPRTTPEQHVK